MDFYKKSNGFILVYDITNKKSFEKINSYYNIIKKDDNNDCCILVGNKIDEKDKRIISYDEGKNLAKELNIHFFETSAKTGKNVNEIFYYILAEITNFAFNNYNYNYNDNNI